jgi:hypothetical protein
MEVINMAMARKTTSFDTTTTNKFTISPNKSVLFIVLFLEKNLPKFASENINSTLGEEDLNQKLCLFLQRQNSTEKLKEESQFIFMQSYKEIKSSNKVDIGVITTCIKSQEKAFFTIECKRLPTPSKEREKEYVCGKSGTKTARLGAIDRFKRERHGKGLPYSAIVAYVEKEDFNHWFMKINNWIQDLCTNNPDNSTIWNERDLLIEQYQKSDIAKYESENYRNVDTIKLIHLWIKMY